MTASIIFVAFTVGLVLAVRSILKATRKSTN